MITTTEIGWLAELKRQLAAKGWTKYKLAKQARISHSTMSYLMNGGIKNPSFDSLSRIADALGVSVSVFVGKTEESSKGSRHAAEFGSYLRQLRGAKEMTIEQLSARSGLSIAQISRIENDVQHTTSDSVRKLSAALGVTHIGMMIKAGHVTEEEVLTFRTEHGLRV